MQDIAKPISESEKAREEDAKAAIDEAKNSIWAIPTTVFFGKKKRL